MGAPALCDTAPPGHSEWDACTVWAQPTDLLRRRTRTRLAGAALLAGLVAGTALVVAGTDPESGPARQASVAVPQRVHRTATDSWADTSRVDFTAWPARGERADDDELVTLAVEAWARPARSSSKVSVATGTPGDPLSGSPQLLYGGEVEERTVVGDRKSVV